MVIFGNTECCVREDWDSARGSARRKDADVVGRGDKRRARRLRARGTDRVEDFVAWVLTTFAAATVLLAVGIGQLGHNATLARANAEAAARTPARATLLEDVDGTLPGDGSRPRTALARWTAPDGHETRGRVIITTRRAIGDTVPVWVDRAGHLVPAPMTASSATVVGWTWGVAVVVGGWATLALLWTVVRAWTARRNGAAWAREWALVEPSWSGRVP
jgi:hypothetical protein